MDAPVTLVEYGNFDCPFCANAYPVVQRLLERFEGSLRFVFRYSPRGDQGARGRRAALAAEAAALQGQFWAMHDMMFERPGALEAVDLFHFARELGLDEVKLDRDMRSLPVAIRVRESGISGIRSGVLGTPTFLVGGHHFRDKPDLESLAKAISAASRKAVSPKPLRRRDGTGHLNPRYEERLRNPLVHHTGGERAFLGSDRSTDALAEELGEEFVAAATGGQYEGASFDGVVPEETGGPFVETSGAQEFAQGVDASNIEGATREPFPTT